MKFCPKYRGVKVFEDASELFVIENWEKWSAKCVKVQGDLHPPFGRFREWPLHYTDPYTRFILHGEMYLIEMHTFVMSEVGQNFSK